MMWRAAIVAALLVAIAVFVIVLNCGPTSVTDGEWTLLTLDGSRTIAGTELRLTLNGTEFVAFDGCNTLRSLSEGTDELVARPDGTFRIPRHFRTEIGCDTPPGALEQAERYAQALMAGNEYKMVGGRLEIANYSRNVTLVFLKGE